MSKTSQRRRSAYQQGYQDAKSGKTFRWARHPFLDEYREGYKEAERRGY